MVNKKIWTEVGGEAKNTDVSVVDVCVCVEA